MDALSQRRREGVRAQLLGGPQSFAAAWSADRVVVAAPEILDIADEPILDALAPGGDELICLTTEDAGGEWPDQAVTALPSEISDWRRQFAPVDVVIARSDLSAAVLLTVDEFILVGGPREVVEKALGQPVEEARAAFAVYAAASVMACRHLPGIAERYGSP